MKFKRYLLSVLLEECRKPIPHQDWNSEPHQIVKMNTKDFPSGRLISYVELSPEAHEAASKLLDAGKQLHERMAVFSALIPDGCSHQFYGNWDCIIVREPRELHDDSA